MQQLSPAARTTRENEAMEAELPCELGETLNVPQTARIDAYLLMEAEDNGLLLSESDEDYE